MRKIAFITGASSGIGRASALSLAKEGFDLILCGRRVDALSKLAEEIGTSTLLLTFDVGDNLQVVNSIDSLPSDWKNIDVLLNNAGNAHGLSAIQDGELTDWEAMMNSNVMGLLHVSKAIIPLMIQNKKGHIINISSIAGKQVYPNGNVYCASKAAVEALSQGMRQDLNTFGIKVSNVAPGAVNTGFSSVRFKGDQAKADAVYQGFTPLIAEDIADLIKYIVLAPAHVNIADVTILPSAQASASQIKRDA
ncbi:SDR family NAD(P)-dependent oxidoreductase [Aquirufa sp. ROCK2-A2]